MDPILWFAYLEEVCNIHRSTSAAAMYSKLSSYLSKVISMQVRDAIISQNKIRYEARKFVIIKPVTSSKKIRL